MDECVQRFTVTGGEARMRVDQFLANHKKVATRSQVRRWIDAGAVLVDGETVKAGALLRSGQLVSVERPPEAELRVDPEAIPLAVLYEDADLIVIDKPAGLVVHPAPGNWTGTVVNALLHRLGETPEGFARERPGIVHRLDKDTSGVLVIARNVDALAVLAKQFQQREIHKQYQALVWGRVKAARGIIRAPIGRHPTERKRMAVRPAGREAVTRYEVEERFGRFTLLRAFPETGRTHQIRVHLASIGHPIVADAVYGGRRRGEDLPIERHALHAAAIQLRHPRSGVELRFAAPLPADFERTLDRLRST